jgi:hypothetical protein
MSGDGELRTAGRSRLGDAQTGDWLEVHQIGGGPVRRVRIEDVLGEPERPHFRVRWNEASETLHYPADGDRVVPRDALLEDRSGG